MPENPYRSPEETDSPVRPLAKRHFFTMFLGSILVILGLPFLLGCVFAIALLATGRMNAPWFAIAFTSVIGIATVTYGVRLFNRRTDGQI